MKSKFCYFFFFFAILNFSFVSTLYSQHDTSVVDRFLQDLQRNVEPYFEEEEDVDIFQELPDILPELDRKLNINTLTSEEALYILQLSEYQYYQIQVYLTKYGNMVSIYELFAVEGFAEEDVERILPFVQVLPVIRHLFPSLKSILKKAKHELLLRYVQVVETQLGYDTDRSTHYLGSPFRLVFRYKYSYSPFFSIAIAGEKDPGEELFKGNRKDGFDHYSYHFNIKNVGMLKSLVIGDYKLDFGQGLLFGSGLMSGKGLGAFAARKLISGIRPVTAMNEGEYLHGVASTIGNHRYSFTLFFGKRSYDGTLHWDQEKRVYSFEGSLSVKGFHRTVNEILKRKVMKSYSYGASVQYRGSRFRVGLQGYYAHFTANVLPGNAVYQHFNFSGNSTYAVGSDYQCLLGKVILYGELAVSASKGVALLQGAYFSLDSRMKLTALFRYYNKNYFALHGKAFGENRMNQNELGFYWSADLLLGKRVTLLVHGDVYRFLWSRYRVDFPANGFDGSVKVHVQIKRNLDLQLAYSFKKKQENISENVYLNTIATISRHQGKVEFEYRPFYFMTLKTMAGTVCHAGLKNEKMRWGFLLYQDVNISISKISVDLKTRFAIFDTDSFDERIYAYEHDLYYIFNMTAYYYRGSRIYFMLKYKWKYFHISFRVSQTLYNNKLTIGSGLDLIDGNRKTDVKLQLLFRL